MSDQNERIPCHTNLSDRNCILIQPYFPNLNTSKGRKRVHSYRDILNAIFYLLRSVCSWRLLPHEFPHWKTVYYYFRIWRLDGTWERINSALRTKLRTAYGKEPEPSAAILYSQSVTTTERPGVRGYDAAKRAKGRKRHILVDTIGLLLIVVVIRPIFRIEMELNLFCNKLRMHFLDCSLFGQMLDIQVNWLIGSIQFVIGY